MLVSAHAERGPEGEVYILGTTNFPDGMKLWVHVESGRLPRGAPNVIASDDGVFVNSGRFRTTALWSKVPNPNFSSKMHNWPDAANLKFRRMPLTAGKQHVHFMAYFNSAWQTHDVLALLGGDGGKSLRGQPLKLTDPDVVDSDKALDNLETMTFPALSPESKAINAVKAAVLTIPGKGRSATDVESNANLFLHYPDLQPAKGWSAEARKNETYEVAFDFINGKSGEVQAIWTVHLKTGEVRYVNENAKIFSWSPNY